MVMTNIFEIISTLQNEGFHIDAAIYNGRVFICYGGNDYDITTVSLSDQLLLIVKLLNT
jgi:hypothetical protein